MINEKELLQCYKDAEEFFEFSLFKVFSEPIRWEIIKYLSLHDASDIGTIAENFSQDRSVISRHLNMMYEKGLLNKAKISRRVVYEVNCKSLLEQFENITDKLRKMCSYCE